jgi:hypothetical protein
MRSVLHYEILSTREAKNQLLQLVHITLPHVGRKARIRILNAILDESGATGLIEPITSGGIVRKPRDDFHGILVLPLKKKDHVATAEKERYH